ncbi:hypothetical protein CASFOL_027201 [Castilleja foliolosa]|uniref:Peptidase A1 domain-containing protein n=1 Tax=Castilleja foliolosa TaxID=1961234 RepID=A0ABD3CE56_9LAMI
MSPLFLILLFSIFPHSSSLSTTLSLSPTAVSPPPLTNPWQKLNHLAAASSTRAHHLKHPKTNTSSAKVPLFPRGYGGYSISLSFGAPPQTLSLVMDTGSSLVWFPCTQRYSCSSCNFGNDDPDNIPVFIPKSSSSSRLIGCKNPKCNWVFPTVQCRDCDNNSTTCNQTCPPYIIEYGSGSTTGLLLSESLNLPEKPVDNFVVGCSVFSTRLPAGIAGFGRGPESLPSQMGLKRFSYCLVSHKFDDNTTASSELVLSGGGKSKHGETKYTPFRISPNSSNPAFHDYYYVTLRHITVGGVNIKAPYKFLVADDEGNGGAIIDSGTTFTFLEKDVFELVAGELEKQVGGSYNRALEVEDQAGLRPCFNVSGENSISLPQLTFHFKGGAKMVLPLADYFSFLDDSAICMTIVTNNGTGARVGAGPAIILGNYQQQNFYMEYDLENERLGFQKQLCK